MNDSFRDQQHKHVLTFSRTDAIFLLRGYCKRAVLDRCNCVQNGRNVFESTMLGKNEDLKKEKGLTPQNYKKLGTVKEEKVKKKEKENEGSVK